MPQTLFFILVVFTVSSYAETLIFDKPSSHPYHQSIQRKMENAYSQLGHKIEYRNIPLKRSYAEAEAEKVDGLMARVKPKKGSLQNLIMLPVPIRKFEVVLLINTDTCPTCNADNIEYVASVSGFAALEKIIDNNSLSFDVIFVPERDILFRMIANNRVQGIIVSDVLIDAELRAKHPNWKTVVLGHENLYHFLNKKHSPIADALTPILQQMLVDE
ncbi:hypothetical protein [Glaciecola petra]|uniref:ABC transporter substrate-binding protein n=1 Tax=Glaciecola petra TaxID=3075602 RepID=A0ABU2ZRN7_9ALTE|nr:hypothetical protein [Aestuariibacter sp. P117]MDT0594911.1 hypothetical protein [Aestuariibacter sp. P117]